MKKIAMRAGKLKEPVDKSIKQSLGSKLLEENLRLPQTQTRMQSEGYNLSYSKRCFCFILPRKRCSESFTF